MKDTFQNTTPTSWLLISEKVIIRSLTKLCPTLCDPKDWSIPGIPVLHYHPEFAQIYVHWIGDAMQPSHPLLPLFVLSSVFPNFSIFSSESALHPSSQTIRASASASVFPMTIQGWFPLKLTGLIYLLFKGLSSFLQQENSNTSILQFSAFYMAQLSYPSMTTSKTIALIIQVFVVRVMSLLINRLSRFVITYILRSKHF